MRTINLVEFHRPDFRIDTFNEIISSLISSLIFLNKKTARLDYLLQKDSINIIFGYHRLFQSDKYSKISLSKNSIIFNLEPIYLLNEHPHYSEYIKEILNFPIIDYSPLNINFLKNRGASNIFKFNFGYINLRNGFNAFSKNKNYIFVGALTEYRQKILSALISNKIKIKISDSLWGIKRDQEINLSKAVINLNKDELSILAVYRIWHSLCLNTPVISSISLDKALNAEYEKYIKFYDSMETLSFNDELISPKLYQEKTSFTSSTRDLCAWIDSIVNN